MKQRLEHIAPILAIALLGAIVVQTASAGWKGLKNRPGDRPEIEILPAGQTFLLHNEVEEIVSRADTNLRHTDPSLYVKQTENLLKENPMVDDAQVWLSPDGRLHIRIRQIHPIALAQTASGTKYLTSSGKITPVSPHQKISLPVIKGIHSTDKLKEYFPLVRYIYDQPSLRYSIKSLRYDGGQLWMDAYHLPVPVLLGDTTRYRQKLYKYKVISAYLEGKERTNPYTRVDLRYKNQIICTKNL